MLKEKMNNAKEFVKEHKVAIGTTLATAAALGLIGYKGYGNFKELKEIALQSLNDELSYTRSKMNGIKESIDRLDPTKEININFNIPERKRAYELAERKEKNLLHTIERVNKFKPLR